MEGAKDPFTQRGNPGGIIHSAAKKTRTRITIPVAKGASKLHNIVSSHHRANEESIHKWNFYLKINFKIQTCLFTIARFSASESLRVYPNIYKNSPPFASSKGFPLVGIAMSVRERESASDSIIIITI